MGKSQAIEVQCRDGEGRGGGTRQRLSGNSLLTELLRALGAAGHASPAVCTCSCPQPLPTPRPPSPLPALSSDTIKMGATPLRPLQDSRMALPAARGARTPPTWTPRALSHFSLFHKSDPQQSKLSFLTAGHKISDVPQHREETVMGP